MQGGCTEQVSLYCDLLKICCLDK